MSSTQKRIHIISQTYQRGWSTDNVRTILVDPSDGTHTQRRIETVGQRRNWWGNDRAVTAAVEDVLGKTETRVTPFLRDPASCWPPRNDARADVSLFIGMHLMRSPAFRTWSDGAAYSVIAKHVTRKPEHEEHIPQFAAFLTRGPAQATSMLNRVPWAASIAASMKWTLVTFAEPMLLTSEQPVCTVPLGAESNTVQVTAMPGSGLIQTLEWRFPVNPWTAMVLTWHDAPDDEQPVRGTVEMASTLNAAVLAQTPDRKHLRHPDRIPSTLHPQTLEPICSLVAPMFLPGYNTEAALASRRRREADVIVNDMIEHDTAGQVNWVSVDPPAEQQAA